MFISLGYRVIQNVGIFLYKMMFILDLKLKFSLEFTPLVIAYIVSLLSTKKIT